MKIYIKHLANGLLTAIVILSLFVLLLAACASSVSIKPTISEQDSPNNETYVYSTTHGKITSESPVEYTDTPQKPSTEDESNEYESEEVAEASSLPSPQFAAIPSTQSNSSSAWVRTDDYLFFAYTRYLFEYDDYGNRPSSDNVHVLYRVPFANITQGEQVPVPGEGEIDIAGISDEYIIVRRHTAIVGTSLYYRLYRISLSTYEATLIYASVYSSELIYWGVNHSTPFFHAASYSLLYFHSCYNDSRLWLEYLCLQTGARNTFFELQTEAYFPTHGTVWLHMEDGAVVLRAYALWSMWTVVRTHYILIDAHLNARAIQRGDIAFPSSDPYGTRTLLRNLGVFSTGAVAQRGDWVYFLRSWGYSPTPRSRWYHRLYRIRTDGTGRELMHEYLEFYSLYMFDGKLFATVPTMRDRHYDAVKLAEDGSIAKVIGFGAEEMCAYCWGIECVHPSPLFHLMRLDDTDLVMLVQSKIGGFNGGAISWITGLYCLTTGAIFNFS